MAVLIVATKPIKLKKKAYLLVLLSAKESAHFQASVTCHYILQKRLPQQKFRTFFRTYVTSLHVTKEITLKELRIFSVSITIHDLPSTKESILNPLHVFRTPITIHHFMILHYASFAQVTLPTHKFVRRYSYNQPPDTGYDDVG